MNDGIQFFDIILFACVAAFLILRLRSVLGRRTGHQRRRQDPVSSREAQESPPDTVIELPGRAARAAEKESAAEADETPLEAVLTQIKLADRSFEPDDFAGGARAAFEVIVDAYAAGETNTLRPLLSNEVYENFGAAIADRAQNDGTLETDLVGIKSADIIDASVKGRTAFVTVKFVSDQINVLRDSSGTIFEGDPNKVSEVTDIWTFARNTRSRDPNWTLVETRSPN